MGEKINKIKQIIAAKRVYTKAQQSFKKLCPKCQAKVRAAVGNYEHETLRDSEFYCDKCKKIIKKYWGA